jgi:hypothetical protein
MKWMCGIFLLFATVALAGLPAPEFRVELRKPEDSVAITSTQTSSVITVTSEIGIGGAKLILTGRQWPAGIVIRLKLKNLESFEMNNGTIQFNTSIKSSGVTPYWKVDKAQTQSGPPAGTLNVTVTRTDETIDVTVPREILLGNPKEIGFEWVNEFR